MYEIEKISYTNKCASATTSRLRNQTLFANATLLQQSINNGLINTTNTVAWTGGNSGNGSSATPIEEIEEGAVDTTVAFYNTLINSVRVLPSIPLRLPTSKPYPYGCNIIQYNNTGVVQWDADISGTRVANHSMSTDGTNVYAIGDFSGAILIVNSDRTQLSTRTPITTDANGSYIVKYSSTGIAQWVAYLTSQTLLQLTSSVTDGVNSYQVGNCFINTNVYNSSGTLYRTLKQTVNMYLPGVITNDGTYIYIIDSNPIAYQFKITGELLNTYPLGGYGLSSAISSITWLNGYLYIVDNKTTIWQLKTTFTLPPVEIITSTKYPYIKGSISITSDTVNILYIVNANTPNVIVKARVNTTTPPILTYISSHTISPPTGTYSAGIIAPLCVSYTNNYNPGTKPAYLIITDYNNGHYPAVKGIVWKVGPVNTNMYTATVLATTSTAASSNTNIQSSQSVQGVYAIYDSSSTILYVYLTLYGSNNVVKFYQYNNSLNIKNVAIGGTTLLLNITYLGTTLYVPNSTATGSLYSINSTNLTPSTLLYPLAINYTSAFIIQYTPSGLVSWISQIASTNANCTINAVIIGKTGIYITGSFGVTANLVFYNQTGESSGLFLTSTSVNNGLTAFVAKYTTSGTALWATKIGNGNTTSGISLAVDAYDNVYATGTYNGTRASGPLNVYSTDSQTNPAAVLTQYNSVSAVYLVKYTPDGSFYIPRTPPHIKIGWATTITAATTNTVNSITINTDRVYLVGSATGDLSCNNKNISSFGPIVISPSGNGVIINYSTSGVAQWVTTLLGGIPLYISLFGNYLYVSGQMTSTLSMYNVPYDMSGAVIPPPTGQPVLSGLTLPCVGAQNNFLITYTTAGIAQWAQNTSAPYVTSLYTGGLTYGKNVEYVAVSILPP